MLTHYRPQGKGEINTYWLLGRTDYKKELPDFDEIFGADDPPPPRLPPTQGKNPVSRSHSLMEQASVSRSASVKSETPKPEPAMTANGSAASISSIPTPMQRSLTPVDILST